MSGWDPSGRSNIQQLMLALTIIGIVSNAAGVIANVRGLLGPEEASQKSKYWFGLGLNIAGLFLSWTGGGGMIGPGGSLVAAGAAPATELAAVVIPGRIVGSVILGGGTPILVSNATANPDDLSNDGASPSGKPGLSKAGRSLAKHGLNARPGNSAFPPPKGNPEAISKMAQEILDDILTHPDSMEKVRQVNGQNILQVYLPDGTGIVYKMDANGKWAFSYFAENLY